LMPIEELLEREKASVVFLGKWARASTLQSRIKSSRTYPG